MDYRNKLKDKKKIVIKIGSSSLMHEETGLVEAGYNAAILQEALGNLSKAEAMMTAVYNANPDSMKAALSTVLDLYTDTHQEFAHPEEIIKHTEEMKTGRLLRYPCEAGAVLGNATEDERNTLIKFSRNLGIAFQITDDILDVVGDEKVVGKTLKKDKAQAKLNFVSIYGVDKAKALATDLINEAESLIDTFGTKADNLKMLSRYFLTRNH